MLAHCSAPLLLRTEVDSLCVISKSSRTPNDLALLTELGICKSSYHMLNRSNSYRKHHALRAATIMNHLNYRSREAIIFKQA